MPWPWESDTEERIYQESVRACLEEPRTAKRLDARPGISPEAVLDAMGTQANVERSLQSCDGALRGYRESVARQERVGEAFVRTSDGIEPNARTAVLYTLALTTLVCWFGGADFLFTLVVLLALTSIALAFALRNPDSRAQSGRWATLAVLGLIWAALRVPVRAGRRAWSRELRRDGTNHVVPGVVDELLGDDADALLLPRSSHGLRSPRGRRYIVENDTLARLQRKLEQIDSGTIAVSGPRGTGKTTLLESCLKESDFAVIEQAPSTYAPHDFLSSLFVTLCTSYMQYQDFAPPAFARLPTWHWWLRVRVVQPLTRLARWLGYAVPAAALIFLGLYAAARSLQEEYGTTVRNRITDVFDAVGERASDVWQGQAVGTALVVTGVGVLVWMLRYSSTLSWVLRTLRRRLPVVIAYGLICGSAVLLAFDPDVRRHASELPRHGTLYWLIALAVAWWICNDQYWTTWFETLRVGRWSIPKKRIYGPLNQLFLPLLALLLLISVEPSRLILTDPENPARLCAWLAGILLLQLTSGPWSLMRPEPALVTTCRNRLYRLQTVQSSSSALNTATLQLLTLGATQTASVSTVPPNYPELVSDFRDVLGDIARTLQRRGIRVIIAIDELDRLGTDTQALAFLSEIKAILGVPHVRYLISVAEDVGAAFVRRGLPHRDVTDSSLDDVIHVQPGLLAESTKILTKRAPDITAPYILLAHALSGGIPRDLIRYARRLLEVQKATSALELTSISRSVIAEELSETLAGFRTLLAKQQWTPETSTILGSFRSLVGYLRTTGPHRGRELQAALEHFAIHAPRGRWAELGEGDLPDEARVLIDEAATYAYFSLTLLDIFGRRGFNRRRTSAAGRGPDGDPELLAEARLELAVSPYSARPLIDGIRQAWGLLLSPSADPSDPPAGPVPPPSRRPRSLRG
ncbi:P-loop NTPase fold protein [Streptomyces sp. NPDC047525]|uniref:P-loop NTPase fold protein n=1 Tax=Streptomyces sp. NPDC047525 TaxID=3155264 RepID=UPI0033EA02C7